MKYFLIFFLGISSMLVKADWIRGTITLRTGEEKTGYIKNLKSGEERVVEYKLKLKDEPLEINSENISEMLLRTSDGSLVVKYLVSESIGANGEYKAAKLKSWMRVAFRGDFDVMCSYSGGLNSTDYYINWPGEEYARMIYIDDQKGVITFSKEDLLRKSVGIIFKNKCDLMISEIIIDQFNPEGIGDVLRYYVEHCKTSAAYK